MSTKIREKLILIDANALVHRAFHALPPTLSSNGIQTNAVYGFTAVLLKMLKDLRPDYIAAAFDLAAPTFRHEEFAEYKSHRVKGPDSLYAQIPITKEMLKAFGIPIFEKEAYEADDLIGTLTEEAKKIKDLQIVIVTGDLDTLQLVDDDKVVIFTLRKGVTDTVTYDEQAVKQRYGLEPHQVIDFKGLKGDPSDNIPGVPGIGEKTASALIQKFGNLENLYAEIEAGSKNSKALSEKLVQKLVENKDLALFSKKLATIVRNVPIKFDLAEMDWQKHIDIKAVEKNLKDLGFYSLIKRVPEVLKTDQKIQGQIFETNQTPAVPIKPFQDNVLDAKEIAIDLLTDASNDPTNLVMALNDKAVYTLPISGNLLDKLLPQIKSIMGHDLKIISKISSLENGQLFDTKIAAYLINPDLKDYSLVKVYYSEYGQTISENHALRPVYIYKLKSCLWEKMKSLKLLPVFEKIEMPLIKVLAEMETNGILIDSTGLKVLLKSTNKELLKLEKEICHLAGCEFNINSPQQLGEVLFNRLNLKGRIRRTGGGALSTAAPELEKIRDLHPIINLILEYRELQKLKTTYIEPFPMLVGQDGRIHTTYNQTGATTGRLASQDPNLQNIPQRAGLGQEFRKSFIAGPGYDLVAFDYSQLELRVVAHIAQDKKMADAFKRGEDIHTRTAVEIFKVKPENVTKEMRRQAKVLNFGIVYGMGALGFARASGVDRNKAREFIDKYFQEFDGVARYMREIKQKALRDGYVTTIFGRRRPLPDIESSMPQLKAQAERMAINQPVQGTGADLIKLAMIKIYDYIHQHKLEKDVKMLLQVHDELVFEIKSNLKEKAAKEIKKIMENIHSLDVPLIVDVKYGQNWSEMTK